MVNVLMDTYIGQTCTSYSTDHSDQHSECDSDDGRSGSHSDYSDHSDQMWDDGEEE